MVAANGGSDLIYLPNKDRTLAKRVLDLLLRAGLRQRPVRRRRSRPVPGTLPLSAISLRGKAVTPRPAIVVNFRSFSTGCDEPLLCAATVADATQQQGQGMHGSFSRADTMNFMAAIGPDFKTGFVDEAPVSNADVGSTIAQHSRTADPRQGHSGRPRDERSDAGRRDAQDDRARSASPPGRRRAADVLELSEVGRTRYFDAAGFPGRTVGLVESHGDKGD